MRVLGYVTTRPYLKIVTKNNVAINVQNKTIENKSLFLYATLSWKQFVWETMVFWNFWMPLYIFQIILTRYLGWPQWCDLWHVCDTNLIQLSRQLATVPFLIISCNCDTKLTRKLDIGIKNLIEWTHLFCKSAVDVANLCFMNAHVILVFYEE